MGEYLIEAKKAADKKHEEMSWLMCFMTNTPPSFDACKEFCEQKGFKITKDDYNTACKKMCFLVK